MIGILNTAIGVLAKLPFLKKAVGKITVTGILGAAVGKLAGVVAPHIVTDQNLVPLIHAAAEFVTAVFGGLALVGFGRRIERTPTQ